MGFAIRLLVSFKVYASRCDTTGDRCFPNGAPRPTTIVFKRPRATDID
jgi:hypothetical protein